MWHPDSKDYILIKKINNPSEPLSRWEWNQMTPVLLCSLHFACYLPNAV